MSGFLPDLANWALRGQRSNDNPEEPSGDAAPTLSMEEIRAQRLARMQVTTASAATTATASTGSNNAIPPSEATTVTIEPTATTMSVTGQRDPNGIEPMAVDSPPQPQKSMATISVIGTSTGNATTIGTPQKKKTKCDSPMEGTSTDHHQTSGNQRSQSIANRKLQRKKELLLKKVLQIALAGGVCPPDNTTEVIDVDGSTEISVQSVAEILVSKLSSMEAPSLAGDTRSTLIAYLIQCHRRATDEIKALMQQANSSTNSSAAKSGEDDTLSVLQELQSQLVSYAASCLVLPGLFRAADDALSQLAICFRQPLEVTVGTNGPQSSFWYLLCEELIRQHDDEQFRSVVHQLVDSILDTGKNLKSVLDGDAGGSALTMVASLTAVGSHKRAAEIITQHPQFLLPSPDSPDAAQQVRPSLPTGVNLLHILGDQYRPYRKRSGVALEKDTVMGKVFRLGLPRSNPAFAPTTVLRQTMDSINRTNSSQRQQLRIYQEAINQFIMMLIKGGEGARTNVMQWFTDALLVNTGAAAMQPDTSKVSSSTLLLNLSVILLKLCEPVVHNPSKHHLIDPGFVSSTTDHKGLFAETGDDAIARLGGDTFLQLPRLEYNPRNRFIPACFFLCARSLHLGMSPCLRHHENLLRHISHIHWDVTSNGRDLHSDPNFAFLISKQRSLEVALFQGEMVTDTLRFCNVMAKVVVQLDEDGLRRMPEDFVDDICHIALSVAKMKGSMMRGVELDQMFHMVVKLLSAGYASIVRNYNLRARLGDVLYELYLPSAGNSDRRDVPVSIATNPMAGGQTYLLSDPSAQETLAPSLLLLYGEVEHTGYYDKMSHRAKIASLIRYLWESTEHRPAFRRITQNKDSFIKFANGIMNETNTLIATVMQKLPEIRNTQELMKNAQEWSSYSEEEQNRISSRLDDNERDVKHALPLCNKTMQMFGYLNTDPEIRNLFLLEELCPRLVGMLLHVLTKLVGSRGLELKVDNPEQYEFRPKEMLRDLCAIFSLFATSEVFQTECARAGAESSLLRSALKTCHRLNLLTGESLVAFESLPELVEHAQELVKSDEILMADAPDEFLDEILSTFMKDPVVLPSGHFVDRSTITQHLLNDPIDPFSREPMTIDDVRPAVELQARMKTWLDEKRANRME